MNKSNRLQKKWGFPEKTPGFLVKDRRSIHIQISGAKEKGPLGPFFDNIKTV